MKLDKGAKALKFEAEDAKGRMWQMPEDQKGRNLVLVFLRHLGCPLCMRRIDELKKEYGRFSEMNAELMVVVQSTKQRAAKYAEKKSIPYPLIGDKEKKLYDLFGVQRGGIAAFMAPRVLVASAKATMKGYFHGAFDGDELQKPAEFIIKPGGEIAWSHYGEDISDATGNEKIFNELKGLT